MYKTGTAESMETQIKPSMFRYDTPRTIHPGLDKYVLF